jgi:hypothetical protein
LNLLESDIEDIKIQKEDLEKKFNTENEKFTPEKRTKIMNEYEKLKNELDLLRSDKFKNKKVELDQVKFENVLLIIEKEGLKREIEMKEEKTKSFDIKNDELKKLKVINKFNKEQKKVIEGEIIDSEEIKKEITKMKSDIDSQYKNLKELESQKTELSLNISNLKKEIRNSKNDMDHQIKNLEEKSKSSLNILSEVNSKILDLSKQVLQELDVENFIKFFLINFKKLFKKFKELIQDNTEEISKFFTFYLNFNKNIINDNLENNENNNQDWDIDLTKDLKSSFFNLNCLLQDIKNQIESSFTESPNTPRRHNRSSTIYY